MKTKLFIPALLIFSIFISCNKSDKQNYSVADLKANEPEKTTDLEKKQIPVGKYKQGLTDSAASPLQLPAAANIDWDKKIIKTATVRLEIKDFKKYNDNVHKTVKQFGAYIAQEEQNLTDEKSETVISIKVPVDQFETMMNLLPGDDVKVLERKITTEDVTGEIVDTRSRLEAKKQMRIKYLEFLKQSKNMEEVLQVQNEINGIQEENRICNGAGRVSFTPIILQYHQPDFLSTHKWI